MRTSLCLLLVAHAGVAFAPRASSFRVARRVAAPPQMGLFDFLDGGEGARKKAEMR